MKERLSRLNQVYANSPIYYVTCCTHERKKILATDSVHEALRNFISRGEERGVVVGRYVIMPDHLHLFVAISDEMDLSGWMKSLKNSLSKCLRAVGVHAPHWQKGFFDHVLRSNQSYEGKWFYLWHNPVEDGLVSEPSEWVYQGEIHQLLCD